LTEDDFEWDEGKFDGGITAFGPGSIDVEDSDSIATISEALTVAAWFRVDIDSDTGIRKQEAFLLEDQSASEPVPDAFSFRIWTDQGLSPGFYGSTELEQEVWYHIAGTYDSDTGVMEMYINGEPESENGDVLDANGNVWDPKWGGLLGAGSSLLQLKYGPESYTGAMDEVVILNRALSGDEIKELMNGWSNLGGGGLEGDYNDDGILDALDIDLQAAEMKKPVAEQDLAKFDHNGDGVVDLGAAGPDSSNWGDRLIWIRSLRQTSVGDANLDNVFDSGDLVGVFGESKYGTGEMATWAQGDWNGDMLFDSGDLVLAFQDGGYVTGATAAVPEPGSYLMLTIGLVGLAIYRRRFAR
jgi:hypothetical protein